MSVVTGDSSLTVDKTQTQSLFHTYSQFANANKIPPKPTDEERDTETKIEELLEKVR